MEALLTVHQSQPRQSHVGYHFYSRWGGRLTNLVDTKSDYTTGAFYLPPKLDKHLNERTSALDVYVIACEMATVEVVANGKRRKCLFDSSP